MRRCKIKTKQIDVKLIQYFLYRWNYELGHKWLLPNTYIYNWESDFLSVTKSYYVHEYEIKLSKSDLLRDKKKEKKFEKILNKGVNAPNYFWYVMPKNVLDKINVRTLPKFAGVMLCREYGISIVKKPLLLHTNKLTDNQKIRFLNGFNHQLWKLIRGKFAI